MGSTRKYRPSDNTPPAMAGSALAAKMPADCVPIYVTTRVLPSLVIMPDTTDEYTGRKHHRHGYDSRGQADTGALENLSKEERKQNQCRWGRVGISLLHKNPFILRDQNGEEKPAPKLSISTILPSCDHKDIETGLSEMGCNLRSTVTLR